MILILILQMMYINDLKVILQGKKVNITTKLLMLIYFGYLNL
jgi:hypothetical protein